MKKSEFRDIFAAVLVFLLVILVFVPDQGLAAEVWSDDFNRDLVGEDWLMQDHVTITNGRLRGTNPGAATYHLSAVSVGTWSFDVLDVSEWEGEPSRPTLWVYFMCSDPSVPGYSYYSMDIVRMTKGEGYQYVYYLTKDSTRLASYDGMEGDDLDGTLHHMAISRTDSGVLRVFLNNSNSPIIEVTNTEITTSECFKVIFGRDFAIDNLVVDDTPREAIFPLEWLIIGIGGAGVVIVAVVVFLRRR